MRPNLFWLDNHQWQQIEPRRFSWTNTHRQGELVALLLGRRPPRFRRVSFPVRR